jgi:nitronate monooxygenase
MWPKTDLADLLGIDTPVLQAPMAGGITTPELVAAVSNAGALGCLGCGYSTPAEIRAAIRAVRDLTDRPFCVNLMAPRGKRHATPRVTRRRVDAANARLNRIRAELGLPAPPPIRRYEESFEDQMAAVIAEGVPAFSFTFGTLSSAAIAELRDHGTTVLGTATTPAEAQTIEAAGVDAVIAQGSEAGGHRATFLGDFTDSLLGLMALVPQVVDVVGVPVIGAGAIMDGRGIAAALALGATGVQMGTAFLACAESGAPAAYKELVRAAAPEDTVVTATLTGRPARGIRNRFIADLERQAERTVLPYPAQAAVTQDIRRAAFAGNRGEYMPLWAGQAGRLCRELPAQELVKRLVDETADRLARLTVGTEATD